VGEAGDVQGRVRAHDARLPPERLPNNAKMVSVGVIGGEFTLRGAARRAPVHATAIA
jgi:hypothetical protein